MQDTAVPRKETTKKLLKRILAAFLAVVLIATSTMLVEALIIRREAMRYREEMGLSAKSARWDKQLVSLNEHVQSGDYDLALKDIEKAMKKGADEEAGMWLKKAAIEVLLEDYDAALKDIEVSIAMDPGDSDAYMLRGEVAYTLGDTETAKSSYRKYLEFVPGDEESLQTLAELDYGAGDCGGAAAYYDQLIDGSQSPSAAWYLGRASCRAALGEYTAAIQDCRSYLDMSSGEEAGAAHYLAAVCGLQLGYYEEADLDFLASAKAGYEPADCYEQSVLCRFAMSDFAGVLESGGKLIGCGAEPADAGSFYQWMGVSAMSLEDYKTAAGYLEKGGEDYGDNAYYLGVCRMYLERYDEAIAAFSVSIENGYDLQLCYYNRGVCRIYQEEYGEARSDLQAAADMGGDESVTSMAQTALQQLSDYT